MINVALPAETNASELAELVREHLDQLATYATHLVGNADEAMDYVAGGIYHATKYPPARIRTDGRAALYRAVTRACKHQQCFPPRQRGPARFFRRHKPLFDAEFDADAARRMNTVKRALMSIPEPRRAALLLRDLAGLNYGEMATALECSPESAGRLLAAARRDFGTIYREIAL
jgi:DNA-directed RNA polymerase specialized sigma24 family protein